MFPIRSRLAPLSLSLIVLIASSTFLPASPTLAQTETVSTTELEAEILTEINRLRTNPPRYAQWLGTLRRYYNGTTLKLPGEGPIETQEGIAALEEAIATLETARPVLPLTTSTRLNQQAQGMLSLRTPSQQPSSVNNVTPLWLIMHLVIADGQSSRQSREALLAVTHRTTGIACSSGSGSCVVSYNGQVDLAALPMPLTPIPIAVRPDTPITTPETPTTPIAEFPTSPEPEVAIPIPIVLAPTAEDPATEDPVTEDPVTEVPIPELPVTIPLPEPAIAPQSPFLAVTSPETAFPEAPTEPQTAAPEFPVATAIAALPVLPKASTSARDITATTAEVRSLTAPPPSLATRSLTPVANLLTPSPEAADQGYLLLLEGALENGDSRYEDGSLYDEYLVQGGANQSITINLQSTDFDTFLAVFDAEGQTILAQNDDAEESRNSQVTLTLPEAGLYRIFVNGYNDRDRGEYTITVH